MRLKIIRELLRQLTIARVVANKLCVILKRPQQLKNLKQTPLSLVNFY